MTESDTLVAPDCDRGKAKDDPTWCPIIRRVATGGV